MALVKHFYAPIIVKPEEEGEGGGWITKSGDITEFIYSFAQQIFYCNLIL